MFANYQIIDIPNSLNLRQCIIKGLNHEKEN
jgi:hypothetical protein